MCVPDVSRRESVAEGELMSNSNFGATFVAIWNEVQLTTPDPFRDDDLFYALSGETPPLYRDRLVQREINYKGDVIPQIERVKRNIQRLGDPHLPPSRLPC